MKDENSNCMERYMLTPIWKARVGKRFSENNETAVPISMRCLETSENKMVKELCKVLNLFGTTLLRR